MSMREHPASGYVVKVEDLVKVLPDKLRQSYRSMLDADDTDQFSIQEWLEEYWPSEEDGFPPFESVWSPSDTDTVDGEAMQEGGIYVIFEEGDLFVKMPRRGLETLREAGVDPEFSRWSVWG